MKFTDKVRQFIRGSQVDSEMVVFSPAVTHVEADKATILPRVDGQAFNLYLAGELLGSYSRARDAKRGAARRGLTLA